MGRVTAAVCTLGAIAICASGTATAAGETPDFGRCVKVAKGGGAFKSANCTIPLAGGNYEWMSGPGPNNRFTFARTEPGVLLRTLEEVNNNLNVNCKDGTGTGEYTGEKTVGNVAITLSGCESGKLKCNSAGQAPGIVVLNPLEGALGVIKKGETSVQDKVGLDLFPAGEAGLLLHVECAGLTISARGSVIVPVISKRMQLGSTLKFKEAKGRQKPEQFEGAPRDVLEMTFNVSNPFLQAGMAFEAVLTDEEPIEINPVA